MSNKRYRLKVNKSLAHVYVSLIDDVDQKIIASSSTLSLKFKQANIENCYKVGEDIAKKAKGLKVQSIVFDRNHIRYHGRIKSLADGARGKGLEF